MRSSVTKINEIPLPLGCSFLYSSRKLLTGKGQCMYQITILYYYINSHDHDLETIKITQVTLRNEMLSKTLEVSIQ